MRNLKSNNANLLAYDFNYYNANNRACNKESISFSLNHGRFFHHDVCNVSFVSRSDVNKQSRFIKKLFNCCNSLSCRKRLSD